MPVEMEGAGGFVQTMKLGFNETENPFIAAQRFLDQNGLDQSFHAQVADWIMQRGGAGAPTLGAGGPQGGATPMVGMPGGNSGSSSSVAPPRAPPAAFSFSLQAYLSYSDLPPTDKLLSKIQEFSLLQESAAQLSESDLNDITFVLETLKSTSTYHSRYIQWPLWLSLSLSLALSLWWV